MQSRAHLFISGRVQGVYYRGFTEELALSLGLNGWVRNLPDRRVEAVFEGERSTIEEAIVKCKQGPPAAHITDMDVDWEEPLKGLQGFEVRY